ncbi:MAG: RHS repeat-associated core domain-containing protein [Clostridia bacterium]|nr:RHS repeat-associated core domain-containing protein [Clostridia bacterium]
MVVQRDRSECSLSLVNPFLYRGYIYDKEYGLYYLQSRYYDPETCRFINPDDPEAIAYNNGDLICNLYTYCLNNPINNTDISGNLTAQLAARIILGIMIGIIVQLVSDIIDIMIARILGADEKRPVGSEYLASALSWALTCVSVNKKACRS